MTDHSDPRELTRDDVRSQAPGRGTAPTAHAVEPACPPDFGLVQVWWGDGKGKTTAALGMGFRAAGHGYRVHLLQFMKGGAASVEATRGEYNAIAAMPGFSYEHTGQYGWHGMADGTADADHRTQAAAGLARTVDLLEAAVTASADPAPLPLDGPPTDGLHMLILDEVIYAANRDLVEPDDVVDAIRKKPPHLELVLTGGHTRPDYLADPADLITHVQNEKHPIDTGQRARKGTEY